MAQRRGHGCSAGLSNSRLELSVPVQRTDTVAAWSSHNVGAVLPRLKLPVAKPAGVISFDLAGGSRPRSRRRRLILVERHTTQEDPLVYRASSIIESLGVYLPATAVSTSDVLKNTRKRVIIPLERLTGIKSRRVVGPDEFSIDLARRAVEECFAISRYQPSDIQLLICANISRIDGPNLRGSIEPTHALQLKALFGCDNAIAFDISNACPGVFTAIAIIDAFIRAGVIQVGMVVSGEYISHVTQTAQREIDGMADARLACLTLGDAGAALILEASHKPGAGFQAIDLFTIAEFADYCIGKPSEQAGGGAIMLTDAIRLANVNVKHSIRHALGVVRQRGWEREDLHHVIAHQTSRMTLLSAAREANKVAHEKLLDDSNLINNLSERGNTATTTHAVALKDNILSGRINSDENIAFVIAGSGVVVGTALYTLDDLPERVRQFHRSGITRAKVPLSPNGHRPPPARGVRIASLATVPEGWPFERDSVKMAVAAARECLRLASQPRHEVDLLLNAGVHRTGFVFEPAMAAFIAKELELNHQVDSPDDPKTLTFDVFNGAIGFLNACHLASELIQSGDRDLALVVTSEVENNRNAPGKPLRGIAETGAALLLAAADEPGQGFSHFTFRYFPEYLGSFTSSTKQEDGLSFLEFTGTPNEEDRFVDCIARTVADTLAAEGLDRSGIDVVLPPQVSSSLVRRLRQALELPQATFIDVAWQGVDLYTSSIPYALKGAYRRGLVAPGKVGLIIAVGEGMQVGCAVYRF